MSSGVVATGALSAARAPAVAGPEAVAASCAAAYKKGYQCAPKGLFALSGRNTGTCRWVYTYQWGDGTSSKAILPPGTAAKPTSFRITHRYKKNGIYTVSYKWTGTGGASGCAPGSRSTKVQAIDVPGSK